MEISELLRPEAIVCGLEARDAEDVIRHLGRILHTKGLVKDTFVEATLTREREMPTGLPLAGAALSSGSERTTVGR